MKSIKLISAGVLAASIAGAASAQQIVRVAGSSAFRSATVTAEIAIASFDSAGLPAAAQMATAKTDPKADSRSIIHGWLNDAAHTEVYFENNWTGSAAGVVDLTSGNTALKWYPTNTPLAPFPGTNVSLLGSQPVDVLAAPNVAMSDVSAGEVAASIATQGTVGRNFAAGISAAALVDGGTSPGPVAACTFQWVLGALDSAATPAPFTNLTQNQAAALVANGNLPLGVITGNSSDNSNFVFLVGRNEDSGTRIITFAEAQTVPQFGSNAQQWMLKQDALAYPANNAYASLSRGAAITGLKLWTKSWPVNTIPTLNWNVKGHSGYNGGGDVVAILTTPNPVTGFTTAVNGDLPAGWVDGTSKAYFVSCLGASDAAKVHSDGNLAIKGTALTFNGVSYTKANVQAGIYSLWGYEHLYYLSSATGTQVAIGAAATAANQLADALDAFTTTDIGAAGVPVNLLTAPRTSTGGPIY